MLNTVFPFAAAATQAAPSSNMIEEMAGQFGVTWPLLIAQVVNFCLVAFVLYYFAFRPVLKTVAERQRKIDEGLQFAEESKLRLAQIEREHNEKIQETAAQSQNILREAHEQAKTFMEKKTQEAIHKAEGVMQKAEEAIELERHKMIESARQEITHLVVDTTSKVLGKDLSEKERAAFSESAAKEFCSNEGGSA
tara:strand:+ start:90414 stop:90995 length:582 start_codon:yes stop_codon:yes gene_type:complete